MKGGSKGGEAIEKITTATLEAFELLKELQKDLKQRSVRVNTLKFEALESQKQAAATQKKYEEAEMKFTIEKEELQLKIKKLEQRNEMLKTNAETIATQLAMEQSKLSALDQLEKKCLQLEIEIKGKDELIVKQQLEIDLKNVESLKFKKMSKKYNKALNTVSPQAVNNVQFVKKFPVLESRCNSLIEKLEQTEKERDILLLKLSPVRANSCSGSYKDQLARRDALMINQLSSSNQARSQSSQFVGRSASYIPLMHHPLSTPNFPNQKTPPTMAHGHPPSYQGQGFTASPNSPVRNQTTVSATNHPVTSPHSFGSLPLGSGLYTRNAIPIARSSASISHGAGILAKPTYSLPNTHLMNTPTCMTNASTPKSTPNSPTVTPKDNFIPLSNDSSSLSKTTSTVLNTSATTLTNMALPKSDTSAISANSLTPSSLKCLSIDNCDSSKSINSSLSYVTPGKRSMLSHSVRSADMRLLNPGSDKIILRDRILIAERKKQRIES